MPECNSETGCTCGKSKCSKGQLCIDGVCQDTAYTLKQNGKWVRYGILKNRDYADAEDEEYEYDEEDDELYDEMNNGVGDLLGDEFLPEDLMMEDMDPT